MLFTDGSVNTQSNIGYGAYLAVSERGLSLNSVRTSVKVRRFEHTSSTKLELQTLLWALNDIQASRWEEKGHPLSKRDESLVGGRKAEII